MTMLSMYLRVIHFPARTFIGCFLFIHGLSMILFPYQGVSGMEIALFNTIYFPAVYGSVTMFCGFIMLFFTRNITTFIGVSIVMLFFFVMTLVYALYYPGGSLGAPIIYGGVFGLTLITTHLETELAKAKLRELVGNT